MLPLENPLPFLEPGRVRSLAAEAMASLLTSRRGPYLVSAPSADEIGVLAGFIIPGAALIWYRHQVPMKLEFWAGFTIEFGWNQASAMSFAHEPMERNVH